MDEKKREYYKKLDATAKTYVNQLKRAIVETGTRKEPITTDTGMTEGAIRNWLGLVGFENAGSMNKTTMLFVICQSIKGGYEYIGVDPGNPTVEQMRSAMMSMANNIGVTPKRLQDWMNTVV